MTDPVVPGGQHIIILSASPQLTAHSDQLSAPLSHSVPPNCLDKGLPVRKWRLRGLCVKIRGSYQDKSDQVVACSTALGPNPCLLRASSGTRPVYGLQAPPTKPTASRQPAHRMPSPAQNSTRGAPAWSGTQIWDTNYRVATAAVVPNWSPGPRTGGAAGSGEALGRAGAARQCRVKE